MRKIDSKGREVIRKLERKNYSIKFVEQDNLEKNLDRLYDVIAELLYEDAMRTIDK
ncbi:hypothetical protein [Mesobacillus sp. S13]|uniref:hypothetical protein n=1 Tax=Mesobacillus sp. S13 TaxID=2880221 RepID=UPI001CF33088|nr:hypothetical protein [Mesobacillus sp. S13]